MVLPVKSGIKTYFLDTKIRLLYYNTFKNGSLPDGVSGWYGANRNSWYNSLGNHHLGNSHGVLDWYRRKTVSDIINEVRD